MFKVLGVLLNTKEVGVGAAGLATSILFTVSVALPFDVTLPALLVTITR
jgi:hypothetical protein